MANKMIESSDILLSLFNKKQYNFLQEIDKKLDYINEQKIKLDEKEEGIKRLFEINNIEEENREKIHNIILQKKEKCQNLEDRIKELNQAIIRLVVDKETDYKYQNQDVKQTVFFVKEKIEKFMTLEKKFNKGMASIDNKISNMLEENSQKNTKEKKTKKQDIQEKQNNLNIPRRRMRNGSALHEIEKFDDTSKVEEKEEIVNDALEEYRENFDAYKRESNMLLISEKMGKVFLPYKEADIQSYLLSYPEDYTSYNDVIDKEYILPLGIFMKNQTLSRFREMYDLIRNKELKSMIEAMRISTKFMFKYDLNPAIIAACNTKDELDEYLRCLSENRLEKFNAFDIKFELNLL